MKISPKFLGRLAWFVVNTIGKTLSIEKRGLEFDKDNNVIYVLWHGRLFLPMFCFKNRGINVLVSEHRDGEIITASIESGGNTTVRGSSTRGGARALVKLVKLAKQGALTAFTPDGPKGPKWHFQPGAVYVAAKTGIPIVPLGGSSNHAYYFKSWDSFQLPLPFSKSVFLVGESYYVTGGLDEDNIEFHRAELERRLIKLNREADEIVGAKEDR